MDFDRRICRNLLNNGYFMYMTNIQDYATMITEAPTDNTLSIFDISDNCTSGIRTAWEKKYLNPDFNFQDLQQVNFREICDGIYSFPLFSEEFCKEMINLFF